MSARRSAVTRAALGIACCSASSPAKHWARARAGRHTMTGRQGGGGAMPSAQWSSVRAVVRLDAPPQSVWTRPGRRRRPPLDGREEAEAHKRTHNPKNHNTENRRRESIAVLPAHCLGEPLKVHPLRAEQHRVQRPRVGHAEHRALAADLEPVAQRAQRALGLRHADERRQVGLEREHGYFLVVKTRDPYATRHY